MHLNAMISAWNMCHMKASIQAIRHKCIANAYLPKCFCMQGEHTRDKKKHYNLVSRTSLHVNVTSWENKCIITASFSNLKTMAGNISEYPYLETTYIRSSCIKQYYIIFIVAWLQNTTAHKNIIIFRITGVPKATPPQIDRIRPWQQCWPILSKRWSESEPTYIRISYIFKLTLYLSFNNGASLV